MHMQGGMMYGGMMHGGSACSGMLVQSYSNLMLLFTVKIILVLMLFACLLVIMVRERVIIKVLKEIRDKK